MYKIITVFKYKLKILMSDKNFMLAMTIIPLILTIITGYALKFENENKIPVAICDLDGSDYSNVVIEMISNKDGFEVIITGEETTSMCRSIVYSYSDQSHRLAIAAPSVCPRTFA